MLHSLFYEVDLIDFEIPVFMNPIRPTPKLLQCIGEGQQPFKDVFTMVKQMDRKQLEQCIHEYGKEIYAFCASITPSTQEAEDLYQDTFLKAVELGSRIDYAQNPKSYLASIALRIWKNRKRKYAWRSRIAGTQQLIEETVQSFEQAKESSTVGGAANPVEEAYLNKELQHQVREAVAKLDEKYRIPVYLYYTVQLSVADIAAVLKLPVTTVKNRLHRARKLLKHELEVVLDET